MKPSQHSTACVKIACHLIDQADLESFENYSIIIDLLNPNARFSTQYRCFTFIGIEKIKIILI